MKKKSMPFNRYRPCPPVFLPDRTWPDKTIVETPAWCSVDLRDGNQALPQPMGINEKIEMFGLLVALGFKEIEVAFPSASRVEFDFVRRLIDERRIPEDVTIQVLTPAREPLIRRTFESLKGVRRAIVHLYNSTSTVQRRVVFNKDKAGIVKIAVYAASLAVDLRRQRGGTGIRFEYSPESFTGTEPEFALEICRAVMDTVRPTPEERMIINLPATVEMTTPNVYADRIEWFRRHIGRPGAFVLSVHTHNDRGTAVAAAELAVLAGARRVEGAVFGNGERTGNMDILTMAMNLFSRGVDPRLDFSDIDAVREVYERCTRMRVPPRHPYAGHLVYTAFSGSHQDAINKGLKAQGASREDAWDVPYLPIDPRDVGRDYESVIRINSQSGKGGVAHIMERDWGFRIPRMMQPDFARVVQQRTESAGRELSSREVRDCFRRAYFPGRSAGLLRSCAVRTEEGGRRQTRVRAEIRHQGKNVRIAADGNGPVDAFVRGLRKKLDVPIEVVLYEEHALSSGSGARAVAYIGLRAAGGPVVFGAGIDVNISTASIKAIMSALTRLSAPGKE